jgi:hypothetical protein
MSAGTRLHPNVERALPVSGALPGALGKVRYTVSEGFPAQLNFCYRGNPDALMRLEVVTQGMLDRRTRNQYDQTCLDEDGDAWRIWNRRRPSIQIIRYKTCHFESMPGFEPWMRAATEASSYVAPGEWRSRKADDVKFHLAQCFQLVAQHRTCDAGIGPKLAPGSDPHPADVEAFRLSAAQSPG